MANERIEPEFMVVVHYPVAEAEAAKMPPILLPTTCVEKARFVTLSKAKQYAASLNRRLVDPAVAVVVDLRTNAQIGPKGRT